MRNFIRLLNGFFITGLLVIFYILFIGLSSLMLKLRGFTAKKKRERTKWKDVQLNTSNEDFTSSY